VLVLSRKRDEVVEVRCNNGQKLRVVLVDIDGGKVRLGFDGPLDMKINRKEVWDSIDRGEPKPI